MRRTVAMAIGLAGRPALLAPGAGLCGGLTVPGSRTDGAADARELRLAVVLYGGVSLAIYMHGTTKELHRLVKASALVEAGSEAVRTPSEQVYSNLIAWLAERDPQQVRTRVVVDVIAGTSAGGINGVYLAKAIAHNRSQDSLRDLWLTKGDIAQLLRGPGWLPMALKVPMLLAQAAKTPPLKGDAIARWMHDALGEMDAGIEPNTTGAAAICSSHVQSGLL